ncbi:TetR family transcriptional regulator [Streptomyces sp. WMMB 322]|uniref:TetR family transcriptional regulator n=1 Tax=Streptomyces sp. WMMB 322 TaxID=1286821 RepID=UPI0006E39D20|nr:TetR family transcriptional regulator [Streptomyces sp. WMMB 322]SCK40526.1 transcriptional regulator, TetR family [Streptomyces sp. WMMB 322]
MTGLRERKKQRTRDSLVRAACELFVAKGYEETTVDEIVATVDVSQRTFFRYFTSKEEVAFFLQALVSERYVEAVRTRPPGDESPVEVLRSTLDETWESIGEAIEEIVPLSLYMRMWQIIETTPSLVAVELRHAVEMEERLAAEIARREGVDPDGDARPRVLVAAFSGVMRAAFRRWSFGGDITVAAAQHMVESYVDQLGPALSEDWGDPGRPPRAPRASPPGAPGAGSSN